MVDYSDYYLSRKVGDDVVCGCQACLDIDNVEALFSGVGNCPSCLFLSSLGLYLKGTANVLSGVQTLPQTGVGVRELTVANGYSYSLYNDSICTSFSSSGTADLRIRVNCTDGIYTIEALAQDVGGMGDNEFIFQDTTGAAFGDALTNTTSCGGTATLSEP